MINTGNKFEVRSENNYVNNKKSQIPLRHLGFLIEIFTA